MKNISIRLCIAMALISLLLNISCDEKETHQIPPTISIKTTDGFTKDNDTIAIGSPIIIGIQARGNDANLTNLVIRKTYPDETYTVVLDTGIYTMSLDIQKKFYQNIEEEVRWTIIVMDKNRLSSEKSLTIFKDPNSQFGGIQYYETIIMGYQENSEYGQFLDLAEGKVYFEDSAQLFQEKIELITYFIEDDNQPSPVFSSPGEYDNFSTDASEFYTSIANWNIRKYTTWDISVDDEPINALDFDNCHNDSTIIVNYDEVWGKKKFKWASTGMIIPFQTQAGKKGLLKVIRADETETGSIEFAIKMQI